MIAMQDGERVQAVAVSIPVFAQLITQGYEQGTTHVLRCVQGLPEGARYVRGWVDELAMTVWLLFTHPSFEPVAQGDHIPTLEIVLRAEARDAGA